MTYHEPKDPRTDKAPDHQKAAFSSSNISNAEVTILNRKQLVGYRFEHVGVTRSGRAGKFYTQSPQGRGDSKFTLKFDNVLEVSTENVEAFEGLPAEYLAWKWFPDRGRYEWNERADKHGVEEDGHAMDIDVAREAVKRGYDGIKYGDFEIQDLRTLQ